MVGTYNCLLLSPRLFFWKLEDTVHKSIGIGAGFTGLMSWCVFCAQMCFTYIYWIGSSRRVEVMSDLSVEIVSV